MLILVEGVDGSGKSELCKQLKAEGYKVIQANGTRYLPDQYRFYNEVVNQAQFYNIVSDRSFISDIIYRMQDKTAKPYMTLSEVWIVITRCKIIHCHTSNAFTKAQERGEDEVTDRNVHKQLGEYYNTFMTMLKTYGIPVCDYDYHKDHFGKVIEFIEGGVQDGV